MARLRRALWRTLPLFVSVLLSGCSFLSQRGEDFLDVWRADLHLAGVPGAWIHVGPLAHIGLGTTRIRTHGLLPGVGSIYNQWPMEPVCQGDAYVFLVHSTATGTERTHLCFGVLPGLFHLQGQDRPLIHLFDLELGTGFGFGGFNFGFSPGQLLDFLLGWFGLDIAGDDPPAARFERSQRTGAPGPPAFTVGDQVVCLRDASGISAGWRGRVIQLHALKAKVHFPDPGDADLPHHLLRKVEKPGPP